MSGMKIPSSGTRRAGAACGCTDDDAPGFEIGRGRIDARRLRGMNARSAPI